MRYARCVDLLDDLHAAIADGTYPRRLKGWASAELVIIDDVGLGQIKKRDDEPTAAHTLYNRVDRRHDRGDEQHLAERVGQVRYLGDATLTAAILDRLAMHATLIDIDGPSYRQHVAEERAASAARMSTVRVRRLPRVMPLAQVAREVLMIDPHEAYKMAKAGAISGAFKIGKLWYVSLPAMIAAMQGDQEDECGDPLEGLLDRQRR